MSIINFPSIILSYTTILFCTIFLPSFGICQHGSAAHESRELNAVSLPRAIPNQDTLMSFDDMPSCAYQQCIPFYQSVTGCGSGGITKECFCSDFNNIDCQYSYPSCPLEDLWYGELWVTLTCTGIGYSKANEIPLCALPCFLSVFTVLSCDLFSYDCLCDVPLSDSCLSYCTSSEMATTQRWLNDECAKLKPVTATAISALETVVVSAKVVTITSAGNVVTSTIIPKTTVTVAAYIQNFNTNNNINGDGNNVDNGNGNGNDNSGDDISGDMM